MKVHFTREQIEYLMKVLERKDAQEVMHIFMEMLSQEGIDPTQAPIYLKRIMSREEGR